MSLGERIKQARLIKNMTQDEFAEKLGGLTGNSISALEKGLTKTFRDPDFILKACKILSVSPIWLQFGIGDKELITETIPIIDWEDVANLPVKPSMVKRRVGTTVAVSPKSYGLIVFGNSMTAPTGAEFTFKERCIVIVDPEITPKPNCFVIASHNNTLMLRRLIQEPGGNYLQPLNKLFQQELVTDKTIFHGVVRSMLVEEFDQLLTS